VRACCRRTPRVAFFSCSHPNHRRTVSHFTEPTPSYLRLGVILAGGKSLRFGSPKPLARVGGTQLVERAADALRRAGARPVLITAPNGPDLRHVLPCRSDDRPGLGPIGGLHTGLSWARELGLRGMLCVACDLPFLSPVLLTRLAEIGERTTDTVIAPESRGPLGIEPLCAWYPTTALTEVERRLDGTGGALADLFASLRVQRFPLTEVEAIGDPAALFLNVNTAEDRAAAEAMAATGDASNGSR
jgi:molybdenum cofactor guanylyltransferase